MILGIQYKIIYGILLIRPYLCAAISFNLSISPSHHTKSLSGFVTSILGNHSQTREEFSKSNSSETGLNLKTLRYVIVFSRHGSKTPKFTYARDPYPYTDARYWPEGPGELTKFGKHQLYKIGQTLRVRYNGFLDVHYSPNETLVKANDNDRDYMSAATALAGLYPPVGYQLWDPVILWQPIPIWPDYFDLTKLTAGQIDCPKFAHDQDNTIKMLDSDSYRYKNLLSYLSNHTGNNITKIEKASEIWDTLQMQYENGYKLPVWTKKVYPEQLGKINTLVSTLTLTGTANMTRLSAGPILALINNHLTTKSMGLMKPDRRLFMEIVHDVTIYALFTALGIDTLKHNPVDTSASIIFELHENSSGFQIEVLYYKNSTVIAPEVINIPNCRKPCYIRDFSKLVDKLAPKNWQQECKL